MLLNVLILAFIGASASMDFDGCLPSEPKIINPIYDGLEGDIYSPGYKEGENYPPNLVCQYVIRAPAGFKIRLTFVDLDLEVIDFCSSDSLGIFEGQSAHGVYCGNDTYPDVVSIQNTLIIVFRTDFIHERKGFHLRYRASSTIKPCERGEALCRNGKCFNLKVECDGTDDCGDGSDEEQCGFPLPTTTCGKRLNDTDLSPDRIVGGQEAIPGSWPWQADLQVSFVHPNGHMCGGTLINAQWILTASHCVMDRSHPAEWRIHIGNHHKFKKDKYEQVRYVTNVIIYPNQTQVTEQTLDIINDMTLLKLNAPVSLNDRVRPACLPSENFELKPGTKCMSTGWGATRGSGFNDRLKEIELTVEEMDVCKNDFVPTNKDTMICTSHRGKANHDVCHGDSGGPLVCKINGEWQLMGDTSFGTATNFEGGLCGLPETFSVYNKVSAKIGWINNMILRYG